MQNAVSQHQSIAGVEVVGILMRQGQQMNTNVLNLRQEQDMPSEPKLAKTKVNNRLSKLARWILCNTGDGIERGEIVARFYGLRRLYCNFYVDPCFPPKQRREHNRWSRYAQPRVTMTLKRLEKRGLVQLIRHGKCVKRVCLTEEGKAVAEELKRAADIDSDSRQTIPVGTLSETAGHANDVGIAAGFNSIVTSADSQSNTNG